MTGNKTAVWRNALGQEIVFDNCTFFLESIDMTGTSGIHTVESLAMTDGQVTLGHHLGAKTIPCSFAWKDVRDDRWMQEHLPALFNPLIGGTLTVRTREETYSIDCYPTDVPVFKREAVPYVRRWTVDFVADTPYWRKGTKRNVSLSDLPPGDNNSRVLVSPCPFEIAPDIYLPASGDLWLAINGKGISVIGHEEAIIIKTGTLEVVTAVAGEDCSQLIDARDDIDSLRISFGRNNILCGLRSGGSPNGVSLSYYHLSMGEV